MLWLQQYLIPSRVGMCLCFVLHTLEDLLISSIADKMLSLKFRIVFIIIVILTNDNYL